MADCPDCGRPLAFDAEEWRDCDPMRELNVRCGQRLDDIDSDETIPDCQRATIVHLRAQLAESDANLARCAADVKLLFIRASEGRALLQRMVKYIREDKATTPGTTRLARLTEQVADYLKRTHDPNSILREGGA